VVNAVTGEPLRRARLTLTPMGRPAGSAPLQPIGAASDAEGKFKFEKIEPARYMLSAEKAGFLRQQYSQSGQSRSSTPLAVASGQKLRDLEIKLTPQAVILGRVVDEDGEPLARASVQVGRQWAQGLANTEQLGMSTNDIGEFRIANLRAGKYTVRVEYRLGAAGPPTRAPGAEGEGMEDYVSTFYPGTTDPGGAVPIEVRAGQEISGIEIRMQKGRVYRVRGSVVGVAVDPASRVQVSLQSQQRRGGTVFVSGGAMRMGGAFEMSSVRPGSYFVLAIRFDSGRQQVLGRTPVTVTNGDVDSVVVQAGAPVAIAGRVQVEGDENARVTGSVLLQAGNREFGGPTVRIEGDGTFKIDNVSRETHHITVSGLPEGMYVKRARAGSVDVLESGLDLSNAESVTPLEIVVSPKGAAIEGVARHDSKPWPGAWVTLVQPDRVRGPVRTIAADQDGRFTLKGVAPGEYRLYAWEEPMPTGEVEPELLKPYEGHAVKVKVAEGGREQVEVKLVRALAGR